MRLKIPKAPTPQKAKTEKTTIKNILERLKKGYMIRTGQYKRGVGFGPAPGPGAPGIGVGPGISEVEKEKETMKEGVKKEFEKAKEQEMGAFKITLAKEEEKGLDIPSMEIKGISRAALKIEFEEEKKRTLQEINIYYNLIPRFPKQGEFVYAYAHIRWDPKEGELIYNLVEPAISERDLDLIEMVKRELEERLDIDFAKIGATQAENLLMDEITNILKPIEDITEEKKRILSYYIKKEIIGLGKMEALMKDPNIEDISCDGVKIPIYIYHRDPKIGSLKTNILFKDNDELDTFTIKIAQRCRKTISIAEPLLDATLPDGSRVQATLGTDIARKGSNFTIRKFTKDPLTPTHMLRYGTMDAMQLAYLWLAIENKKSILISGGTATGKTSMLNALSLFIKPSQKVISIEDTAELRLPHPHWIPEVARSALEVKGKIGEVTLFDLLKSSLRQRPDYIIVGEVRGKETFVLFQQIATGHAGLSTIHAASISQLADRLTTPPISLPPTLLENINIIIFLVSSRLKGNYVRRADRILEVAGLAANNKIDTRELFVWRPMTDNFEIISKSVVLKNVGERLGINDNQIKEELMRRKRILEWMVEQEIYDYREVAKIIAMYYSSPEKILDLVMVEEAGTV